MKVRVTGAGGFIGRHIIQQFREDGHERTESLEDADAVVHLAGEPVAQRWTSGVKQRIQDSRVNGTRDLVQTLSKQSRRPQVLISASAVGYYGSRGDEILTESSDSGTDFLAQVCIGWEREADAAESLGIRVVKLRTGMVLGKGGGALAKMLPPFRAGVGGRLGTGKQWVSWIHMDDIAGIIRFALRTPGLRGPVNGSSPCPVTNAEFTQDLAKALRRPAMFPVPKLALRLLYGEMADMLLSSQRVMPKAAQSAGYSFLYPSFAGALQDVLR